MSNARDKANIPVLNFQSKGIDDNADATAITINSSEKVGIGTSAPLRDLVISNSGAEGYEFGPGETSDINQTLHYNRSSSAYIAHWQRASYHRFDTPTTEAMIMHPTLHLQIFQDLRSEWPTSFFRMKEKKVVLLPI